MHHPTDRIAHTTAFVTPVMEHWLERELSAKDDSFSKRKNQLLSLHALFFSNQQQGIFYMHHLTHRIVHTKNLLYQFWRSSLITRNSSMCPPRKMDRMTYCTTILYHRTTSHSLIFINRYNNIEPTVMKKKQIHTSGALMRFDPRPSASQTDTAIHLPCLKYYC